VKKRDTRLLLKTADKILAKDPKTQAEKEWKKKRARMTKARIAKRAAKRREPGLLELSGFGSKQS
jgi:hypothetical protein